MLDLDGMLRYYKLPKRFTYHSIICECVDFKTNGTAFIFKGILNPSVDAATFNPLEYVEQIPHDLFIKLLISTYYRVTVTKLRVKLLVDDYDERSYFEIRCDTTWNDDYIRAISAQSYLYNRVTGRQTNVILSETVPGVIHNVHSATNPDGDATLAYTISTEMTRCYKMERHLKCMLPYGILTEFSILNINDVRAEFPKYDIRIHDNVFHLIAKSIGDAIEHLRDVIDKGGYSRIGFDVMTSCCEVRDTGIRFATTIFPKYFRSLEVYDATPRQLVYQPNGENQIVINEPPFGINWFNANQAVSRIATNILSQPNTLYIPKVIGRSIEHLNGREYYSFNLEPHVASFVPGVIYDDNEVVADAMKHDWWVVNRVNGFVELTYPIQSELADMTVICYGRVAENYISTQDGILNFINAFTCPEIGVRYICSDGYWRYFAITDEVYDSSTGADPLFAHPYYPSMGSYPHGDLRTALTNIVQMFFASDDIDNLVDMVDAEALKKLPSRTFLVASTWATCAHMPQRSFSDIFTEIVSSIANERGDGLPDLFNSDGTMKENFADLVASMPRTGNPSPIEQSDKTEMIPTAQPEEKQRKRWFHFLDNI